MNQTLASKARKARKPHNCDYCGGVIQPGEVYAWSKNVWEGSIYEWHNHLKCDYVAGEIWEYVEPDEGMSDQDFLDGCQEVCQTFVCPDCPKWNKEYENCEDDNTYCIDRMYEFFQENELYCSSRFYGNRIWKSRRKEVRE